LDAAVTASESNRASFTEGFEISLPFPKIPRPGFQLERWERNITVLGIFGEDAQFTFYYCVIICHVPGFTLQGEEEPFSGRGLRVQITRLL